MAVARRSATIHVMIEAAEKAGRSLVRDFGEVENLQVSKKGPGDFVSTADHKAEKIIRDTLSKARPRFGFLLEEGGAEKGEDAATRWIVDPLDGTMNFLHGIPHWSVSIALEKDKDIVAGVIYDPIKDEMFWAEKGLGAYVNNRRLQVSARKRLADAAIGMETKSHADFGDVGELVRMGMLVRNMGSTCLDLGYVAAGRLDAAFKSPIGGGLWDVAAGVVIVREARGTVTDLQRGANFNTGGSIIAATPAIYAEILERTKAGPKAKTAT